MSSTEMTQGGPVAEVRREAAAVAADATRESVGSESYWAATLDEYAARLQAADSVAAVVELVQAALAALPGVGRGGVFLLDSAGEPQCAAKIEGPESERLSALEMQLAGVARRAMREGGVVKQRGVTAGDLWAAPLTTDREPIGAVAAVGAFGELPRFFAHAGRALQRERGREGTAAVASTVPAAVATAPTAEATLPTPATDSRAEDLDRVIEVLDAIAREGGSGPVLQRVTAAIGGLPVVRNATLWALRKEDDRFVESLSNGDSLSLPEAAAESTEDFVAWAEALPRWGGLPFVASDPEAAVPGAGDHVLLALDFEQAPVGFVLAELAASPNGGSQAEDLFRWGTLARQALARRGADDRDTRSLEELREEKDKLAELHQMKSQFIAAISHELRTPLTSISAYAETLREAPADDEDTRERFLRVIFEESRRLTRIVDDILDLTTMDEGRVRLSCRNVDTCDVIRNAVDVIRPMADSKQQKLTLPVCAEAVDIHADPDLLKQLLVNVLENAVKFTDEGSQIEIRLEPEPTAVRVRVVDNGPGIPTDKLDKIFERFYQVDGTNSRRHNGSGLGLAIARSIATWHDGRIWAESRRGEGAQFIISLPRVRATSRQRAEEPAIKDAPGQEHRVPELLIEMVSEVMSAESVSLMLLDDHGDELFVLAGLGMPDEAIRQARVNVGESISGTVASQAQPILVPDLNEDPRFSPSEAREDQYRTPSLISVPVLHDGGVIGVVNVTNKTTGESFDENDLKLLEVLAQRVSMVVTKLRRFGDSRDDIERMEDAMRGIIDVRRHYYPSRGFSDLLLSFCHELGLSPEETSRIHYASIVRDVGMVQLPESVYQKPEHLTAVDMEMIQRHPDAGAKVLESIEFQSEVFEIIRAHHEEPDGTGYPRGLTASGIPRGAKMLAVLDAYHALRSGRPYREAVSAVEAAGEIHKHAGGQFDADLVRAFLRALVHQGELRESQIQSWEV